MKINKFIIVLLSLAAMLTACAPEDLDRFYAEVNVEPSIVVFDKEGGVKEITITATEEWTITNVPSWIKSVSQMSGGAAPDGITIALEAYNAYESLSGELYVNVGNVSQTVYLSQPFGNLEPSKIQDVLTNGVDGKTYLVQGIVGAIENTTYGNYYLKDESCTDESINGGKGVYIYGTLDAGGGTKNFLSLGIEEGDEIIVSGPRLNYSGKIELVDVTLIEIVKKALLGAEKTTVAVADTASSFKVPVTVKGENATVVVEDGIDWLIFNGIEGAGEDTKVMLSVLANTTGASRSAKFVVSSTKKETVESKIDKSDSTVILKSDLTFTVNQAAAAPALKSIADVDYSSKEYVHVQGTVVATTTKGYVLNDSEASVYIYTPDATREYPVVALGDTVNVIGASSMSGNMNQITVDLATVRPFSGKYQHPEAEVLDSLNIDAVAAENPAGFGYYTVTGFLSSNKSLAVEGSDYVITAIDPNSDVVLKNFYGKYVTAELYNAGTDASKKQIKGVWTSLKRSSEEAPDYLGLAYTSDDLEWTETSASISVEASVAWTASIVEGEDLARLSKTSGNGGSTVYVDFYSKNNTYEEETVVVEFEAEGLETCTYTITRTGKVLSLSGSTTVKYDTREVILSVTASGFWRAEIEGEGASIDKNEGYLSDAIIVTLPVNEGETDLVYTVTLYEDRVNPEEAYEYEHVITQTPYVEVIPTTPLADLSALIAGGNTTYDVLIDAVVTYTNGGNAFLEDATGGMLLYMKDHGLVPGQRINGSVSGSCKMYNELPELTSMDYSLATITEGAEIPCTEITVAELLADYDRYMSCQIKLVDVEVTDGVELDTDRDGVISQNGSEIALRSQDKNTVVLEAGSKGDLVCFPTVYYEKQQVGIWQNDHFIPAN